MSKTVAARINQLAEKYYDEMVRLRRTIHTCPELAFEEFETSRLVAETLEHLGLTVRRGVAKTGVVASLRGTLPGKAVALRSDMDALPITEATGLPFASKNAGKMHACGHDSHTAIGLGAAMILSELKDEIAGEVRFLFQPSEERNPGGAPFMIEEGALDGVSRVYGLHVLAQADAGTVGFCPGEMMASADELYITIRGRSGHGARPHHTIDPVVVSAQVILALQTLVSRNLDPFAQGVISICSIHGGFAPNIVPNEVKLVGTLRAMSVEWREYAHKRVHEIVNGICFSARAEADIKIDLGYPVLVNDERETAFAEACATELFGQDRVFRAERLMGAEDFAYYLQKVPGTFYRLGIRNEAQGITADIHNDHFTIDESSMKAGAAMQAYLAIQALLQ
ncbi:MAG: amidohydrolase [Bacteroidota bacterium]|nr:amidohydrolase [Bacteroidota bacterium]MDP4234000.1 amidohydrolase [Bacteroidota bacterium]MDP4242867.1 amidohydrolase [Bacteroidota bacterium]MDP4287695.1 amidohydrolase [Bacteroidota bacterium]